MVTRDYIVDRLSELAPEDLDALNEYLDRLQEAGDDPVLRALVRASLRAPDTLSPEEEALVDEARTNPAFIPHEEVKRRLLGEST